MVRAICSSTAVGPVGLREPRASKGAGIKALRWVQDLAAAALPAARKDAVLTVSVLLVRRIAVDSSETDMRAVRKDAVPTEVVSLGRHLGKDLNASDLPGLPIGGGTNDNVTPVARNVAVTSAIDLPVRPTDDGTNATAWSAVQKVVPSSAIGLPVRRSVADPWVPDSMVPDFVAAGLMVEMAPDSPTVASTVPVSDTVKKIGCAARDRMECAVAIAIPTARPARWRRRPPAAESRWSTSR